MASVLRTILVDSDAESLATLRRLFAANAGVVIIGEFPDIAQALAEGPSRNPDLLVVEIPRQIAAQGAEAATRVVENASQALPSTAIFVPGPALPADVVIKVIRAGAVEFLTRPVERGDVLAALDKLTRFHRGTEPTRRLGRVTSVFSTKGGLGVTTVATNLAVALSNQGS